jgi:transcriptional regulator with XRE-family HTH domain
MIVENITKPTGVRIKELRAKTKLSQERFAHDIGMARTYFAEVETGKRNVSLVNLRKIANGLGVTLEEFFASDLFIQK